jgi:uncharacterized protein
MEVQMPLIVKLDPQAAPAEVNRPDRAKLVDGDPVHTTWNVEERDGLYCGMWQSTPGSWRVDYAEWEYFSIRSGHSTLTAQDGTVTQLRAGDAHVLRPGFRGVWTVLETTLKDYVILMPR